MPRFTVTITPEGGAPIVREVISDSAQGAISAALRQVPGRDDGFTASVVKADEPFTAGDVNLVAKDLEGLASAESDPGRADLLLRFASALRRDAQDVAILLNG